MEKDFITQLSVMNGEAIMKNRTLDTYPETLNYITDIKENYIKVPKEIVLSEELTSKEKLIFIMILGRRFQAIISYTKFKSYFDRISDKTISSSIKKLKELGLIQYRKGNSYGHCNVYKVNH